MKPIEELLEDAVRDAIVDVFMVTVQLNIEERYQFEYDEGVNFVDVMRKEIKRTINGLNRMEKKYA